MRKLLFGLLLAFAAMPAFAQDVTQKVGVCDPTAFVHNCLKPNSDGSITTNATLTTAALTSANLSGTVAVTNTFQSIQVSTAGRKGCLIQNQSATNAMWVYFGAIGSATKATSFILDSAHGLAISCAVGGLGVVTDQISITGTSADAFAANFQ